jgi:hypothetical protein
MGLRSISFVIFISVTLGRTLLADLGFAGRRRSQRQGHGGGVYHCRFLGGFEGGEAAGHARCRPQTLNPKPWQNLTVENAVFQISHPRTDSQQLRGVFDSDFPQQPANRRQSAASCLLSSMQCLELSWSLIRHPRISSGALSRIGESSLSSGVLTG